MTKLAAIFMIVFGLVTIISPAYGCGFHGFSFEPPASEPSPLGPLAGFAIIIFGFMFAVRSLPRMGQGVMIGFLFALAAGLGVFSFSAIYYPEAFIAQLIIIIAALLTALGLLGYKTKRELWGIAKYTLGAVMGGLAYFSMSGFVPIIKMDRVPIMAQTQQPRQPNAQIPSEQRPTFAVSTQSLSAQSRMRAKNKTTETPEKENKR